MLLRCVILAAALGLLGAAVQSEPAPTPFILFSASTGGQVRSCRCPSMPWGGLAKRAWLIGQLRQAAGPGNVLLLDAGDLLPPVPEPGLAACVLRLYALMRYDAVAIGDQELAPGFEAWQALDPAPPWLSAGYTSAAGPRRGATIAQPWRLFDVAGLRLGVIAVVGPEAYRFDAALPDALQLTDPAGQVRRFIEGPGRQADALIVLSHQGAEPDRALAAEVDGIDLILGGHSQSLLHPPEPVNGTLIFQAGKNGENLGLLALAPIPIVDASAARAADPPDDPDPIGTWLASLPSLDPFEPAVSTGRRWRVASRLVPLDSRVDEAADAATIVADWEAALDARAAEWLARPAPTRRDGRAKAELQPCLILRDAFPSLVLRAGERRQAAIILGNAGDAHLHIERVRGRPPWLTVLDYPSEIGPGQEDVLLLEVHAVDLDRHFRLPYSVAANDRDRPLAVGGVTGRIEGPLPGIRPAAELIEALAADTVPGTGTPAAALPAEAAASPPASPARVLVEFFYAAGCDECRDVDETVLPGLLDLMGDALDLRRYDVAVPAHYALLAGLQEQLGVRGSDPVSVFINRRLHLGGLQAIRDRLAAEVEAEALRTPAAAACSSAPSRPLPGPGPDPFEAGGSILERRLASWRVPAVALAGLLDGLNPCAFSAILFFMTLLAVAGRRGRELLAVGAGFCASVFLTYFLLGFGAFQAVRALSAFHMAREILRWGTAAALLALAAISLRDAWAYGRTGRPDAMALRLPDRLRDRMHAIMRVRLNTRRLWLGSAALGFLVTLIEGVCTGQVYVPTLVVLSRHPALSRQAVGLLLLYNLMFVVPHAVVFLAAWRGLTNARLLAWSRGHVVWSKAGLGLLFLALAAILVLI